MDPDPRDLLTQTKVEKILSISSLHSFVVRVGTGCIDMLFVVRTQIEIPAVSPVSLGMIEIIHQIESSEELRETLADVHAAYHTCCTGATA